MVTVGGGSPRPLEIADLRIAAISAFIGGIAEADIEDRSKGDTLSKGLVVLQTVWFIVQCIVRRQFKHLPLTELEGITLAFAALNVMTYCFWYYKPLHIEYPYTVAVIGPTPPAARPLVPTIRQRFSDMVWGQTRATATSVPTFYSVLRRNQKTWAELPQAVAFMSAGFGSLHFIAFSHTDMAHTEKLLWGISAAVISGVPPIIFIYYRSVGYVYSSISSSLSIVSFFLGFCYVIARGVLIVLAFKSMWSLPTQAYQTVTWSTFAPNIY